MNYEQNIKRLEEITVKLESGECALDDATALFEEGAKLIKECNESMDKTQGKVTLLKCELDKLFEEDFN